MLLAPILIGTVMAVSLWEWQFKTAQLKNPEELAFSAGTETFLGEYQGSPIHCLKISGSCIDAARERGFQKTMVWLGNSQLHAIVYYKTGQVNAPPAIFQHVIQKGIDLVTLSQPNANFQEQLVLFEHFKSQLNLQALLLPAVFDDMRETEIRNDVKTALDNPETISSLQKTAVGKDIVLRNTGQKISKDEDLIGLSHSLQEEVETWANHWLADHWAVWARRGEARYATFLALYDLRNWLFGITPQSKRKIVESSYQKNFSALESILSSAADANIRVLLYIAPIRQDLSLPYIAGEYSHFKTEVEQAATKYGANFVNLEKLVPPELWGADHPQNGEVVDFMHFQASGHAIFGQKLIELIDDTFLAEES